VVKARKTQPTWEQLSLAKDMAPIPPPEWMPFVDAWKERYQGTATWSVIRKALKPLLKEHSPELVLERWKVWLAETPGRFARPSDFANTFGEWDPVAVRSRKDPMAPLPGETTDQYIARVGSWDEDTIARMRQRARG